MTWNLTLRGWRHCRIGRIEAQFEEQDGEELIFRDLATGKVLPPISIADFEAGYDENRIARITSSTRVTPPFAEDDRRMRNALGRQFVLRTWDARGRTSLGSDKLELFLASIDAKLMGKGYARVSAGQLRRDIQNRGSAGDRPLAAMFDAARGRATKGSWVLCTEVIVAEAVDFYYTLAERTITDAVAFFKARLREVLGLDPEAKMAKGREPTPETIRRRIRDAGTFENLTKKYGMRIARARLTGVTAGLDAEAPLECVVIDATRVDTWLVIDEETSLPLGRPVITIAIDVCTRMILGIHIGFEGESLSGLMACIFDILRPKSWISRVYPDVRKVHDGFGRPMVLLWDNALRQIGISARDAIAGVGIDCDVAPITTPEAKSLGERVWRTLNTKLFHKLPGAVPYKPHVMSQLNIDPSVKARISLPQLREQILTLVVDHYHYEVHTGIGMQPARAWKEGIERFGRAIVGDLAEAERLLGTYEEGTVTREGVKFRNHRFHDPELTSQLLRSLVPHEPLNSQRRGMFSSGKAAIKFKFAAADASRIHVFDSRADPPRYVTLPNVKPRYARGLSFAQADMIHAFAKQQNLSFVSDEESWATRDRIRRMIEGDLADLSVRDRQKAVPFLDPFEGGPIVEAHGRPTTSGHGTYDVVVGLAEHGRTDGGITLPQARRGGRKASAKAAKARREGPKQKPRTETFLRPDKTQVEVRIVEPPVAPPVAPSSPTPANGNTAGTEAMSTEELLEKFKWSSNHERR